MTAPNQLNVPAEQSMKRCPRCELDKPLSEWRKNPDKSGRYTGGFKWSQCCNECNRVRNREFYAKHREKINEKTMGYRKTPAGRAIQNSATMRAIERYPEKALARSRLRYAVKRGRIAKLSCEDCGSAKSEAHHYLGYAEEHWYDVKWLCREHHWDAHKFSLRSKQSATLLKGEKDG